MPSLLNIHGHSAPPQIKLHVILQAALLATLTTVASSQEVQVATYAVQCSSCGLKLEKVATLGSQKDEILIDPVVSIARSKIGEFYVKGFARQQVIIFGADGHFISAHGRVGGGPGEFGRGIVSVGVDPHDSIFVTDFDHRVSVFSPRFTSMVKRWRQP